MYSDKSDHEYELMALIFIIDYITANYNNIHGKIITLIFMVKS